MKKINKSITSMPDEVMEKPSLTQDLVDGWHCKVLQSLEPKQLQSILDFMNESIPNLGDEMLDNIEDILEYLPHLRAEKYSMYVLLIASFEDEDEGKGMKHDYR